MKQKMLCLNLILLLLLVLLAGCARYPETAADGAVWDENWLMHGNVLGIEVGEKVTPLENYAVLTLNGLSTSVWGIGTPDVRVDEEGEDVTDQYHALVYVLVKECADVQTAREAVGDWAARLEEIWTVTDVRDETHNGQNYTVRDCVSISEDRPYSRELAAFVCYGAYAISVELDCRSTFDGDADTVLSDFLDGCHYNAGLSE